ncbi:hypothetical protein [Methylobacillus flagellatus]|uniref:hypothetical protein n=1 Tax=Methylobacillus flagellatus TaxID=405 RepID=UPI0010F9DE1B|nr:hypothetical protein [Methylobacillus flagellatus]
MHTTHINKRFHVIEIDGETINLNVVNMHEVAISEHGMQLGLLRFSALSSLNNVEIRPLYSLSEIRFDAPHLAQVEHQLLLAAVGLFSRFTNGRFRLPQPLQAAWLDDMESQAQVA